MLLFNKLRNKKIYPLKNLMKYKNQKFEKKTGKNDIEGY